MKEPGIHIADWSDPSQTFEVEIDLSKTIDQYYCWTSKGPIMHGFVFPIKYKDKMLEIARKRQELKKQYDDSISLVYKLQNELSRERKQQV